jgi:hypothetical protein
VCSAGREHERPARREAGEPALGVERIEQREEVVLIRSAPVEEDERALGLTRRGPG